MKIPPFDFKQVDLIKNKLEEDGDIKCFLIGGTYIQEIIPYSVTKDIDIIVTGIRSADLEISKIIIKKLVRLGFKYKRGTKNPLRFNSADLVVDIFIKKVMDFYFTDSMSIRTHEDRIAPEDFVLLKSQVSEDRPKDIDDISEILCHFKNFSWRTLLGELELQLDLLFKEEGKEYTLRKIYDIGSKFEKIQQQTPRLIPKRIINKLWQIHNRYQSLE